MFLTDYSYNFCTLKYYYLQIEYGITKILWVRLEIIYLNEISNTCNALPWSYQSVCSR